MKYLAILKDSLYETIDFKLLYVLVGISLLLVVACGSFTFPRYERAQVIEKNLGEHAGPQFPRRRDRDSEKTKPGEDATPDRGDAAAVVSHVEPITETAAQGRYRFALTPGKASVFGKAIQMAAQERRIMQQFMRGEVRIDGIGNLLGQLIPPRQPESVSAWTRAIEEHMNSMAGLSKAKVIKLDGEPGKTPKRIEVEVDIDWKRMHYTHQIGLLFGTWKFDIEQMGTVVFYFQSTLVDWIAGWAGLIVALIVTAGFIPNMLQKGTVDLLLVKPIYRPALLTYKYIGGLLFVFFNGVVLVVGSWIAFAINTGNWSAWYLASILVLMAYFAILYSLSVLMGVLTRSPLVAILVTIGFWFILFLVNLFHGLTQMPEQAQLEWVRNFPTPLIATIDWVHFLLPKPGTLSDLNQTLLLKANGSVELLTQQQALGPKISWTETLITSGAFIVVMLGLACWRFSRKDY